MAETGFEIDGKVYEVPRLETFDLDEEQILFDVAGVVQLDFVPAHPDASDEEKALVQRSMMAQIRDPRFKRALAHIAYRRRNPDVSFHEVQERMGKINALDAELAILGGGEDDPPPESSPSEPKSATSSSGPSSNEDSGSPSESDSAPVVEIHAATGTGR
jgi:hypothetical protein